MRLIALVMALILFTAAGLADEPMWVDGNGNFISTPTDESGNAVTPQPIATPEPEATDDPDAPQPWEYTPTVLTASWQEQTVEVLALGSWVSTIRLGRETHEVYTRELTIATEKGEGLQLAMINAPKNGKACMRKRASGKGAIIMKCQTGRIVAVTDATKKYAKFIYEDAEGWVLRSSLTFLTPQEGEATFGRIAYKGNVKSRQTVKVRQKASGSSRVLDEFPCGKRVVIIAQGDKWTEIEADNLRCFILNEFLVVE